jgi:hypothetical protein
MRVRKRFTKIAIWSLVVIAVIAGGTSWLAYALITDSDTATKLIKLQCARFLQRVRVDIGRVAIRPFSEVQIRSLHAHQWIDGRPFLALRVPWLSVRFDARQLLSGRLEAREVIVSQPTLRLCQRRDGTWNLQGLLADPLPILPIESTPPILVRNGTVELIDGDAAERVADVDSPPPLRVPVRQLSGSSSLKVQADPLPLAKSARPALAVPPGIGGLPFDPSADRGTAILRDVSLRIESSEDGLLRFEGQARGDLFNRIKLEGLIDPVSGTLTMEGELVGLTLSENLRRRLPPEALPVFEELGLKQGEVDVELNRLAYRPGASGEDRLRYDFLARLRGGVWECAALPFPINDLSAILIARDGQLTIRHAEGFNGNTTLRAEGTLAVADPAVAPLDLRLDLLHLELDRRLREQTPAEYAELWDVFQPRGHVDAYLRLVRHRPAGPMGLGATVLCRDVSTGYRHFPYPLQHLSGQLTLEKQRLTVDLRGLIGEKPARLQGTIDHPGADAVVRLNIAADAIPIDATFLAALPLDVRRVVERFHPTGSVKALVQVSRKPLPDQPDKPEGDLVVDAALDLNPRCEITWADLPYPVRNLSGRLELHPDVWIFKNMQGRNGQAVIRGDGVVRRLPGPDLANGEPPLKIDLQLQAENLPFNDDLRKSLPPAWQKTWSIINPIGASDVVATIRIEPGRPEVNHIVISPRPESNVRLLIPRIPVPGVDPGGVLELRMENVLGRFEFDNGKATMRDVNFFFLGAPVEFKGGEVAVENSGRFDLRVQNLRVKQIRLDSALRKIMPPLMAQFALRLDDGRPFTARGNLQIGWSGVVGEPAWCRWDQTLVVFNDNNLKAGIPLEHIQGQLDNVSGWSNGQDLEVHGAMSLESVSLHGQQITQLESPFHIERGVARLDSLRGRLLGGILSGKGSISLDATPRYSAALKLTGAELQEYARTLPGRQQFRGTLHAAVEFSGLGTDVRSVQGKGEAHVVDADLGELPVVLRFAKFLRSNLLLQDAPRNAGKSAFDSADLVFRIVNGEAVIDPLKFTGNALSLQGRGTRDPIGNLDLRLKVLYGRDRYHLPVISDLMREASGQFFIVHVRGTDANPKFQLEALPQVQRLGILRGSAPD